jgi:hypothetical protein
MTESESLKPESCIVPRPGPVSFETLMATEAQYLDTLNNLCKAARIRAGWNKPMEFTASESQLLMKLREDFEKAKAGHQELLRLMDNDKRRK